MDLHEGMGPCEGVGFCDGMGLCDGKREHRTVALRFNLVRAYCSICRFVKRPYFELYRLFNVSFNKSTLIKTDIRHFQGLYKTDYSLQKEHAHSILSNQISIKLLNCKIFWAVFIDSGSESFFP